MECDDKKFIERPEKVFFLYRSTYMLPPLVLSTNISRKLILFFACISASFSQVNLSLGCNWFKYFSNTGNLFLIITIKELSTYLQ